MRQRIHWERIICSSTGTILLTGMTGPLTVGRALLIFIALLLVTVGFDDA